MLQMGGLELPGGQFKANKTQRSWQLGLTIYFQHNNNHRHCKVSFQVLHLPLRMGNSLSLKYLCWITNTKGLINQDHPCFA